MLDPPIVAEAPALDRAQDPDKLPPWLKKLVESPLHTDTIQALLPVEPRVAYGGSGPRYQASGVVRSETPDLATFKGTPPNEGEARRLFLHEMGHINQLARPQEMGQAAFDVLQANDPLAELSPSKAAREQPEWVADAFASGITTLNSVMAADSASADQALEEAEKRTPGTRAIGRWLLQQPIYSEHPLVRGSKSENGEGR